jgi:hypothetical protein
MAMPSGEIVGYDFSAPTRFDNLLTGIAVERPAYVNDGSMKGLEDIGPEDTGDGDYGRLLDRHALRVASPAGFEPALPA